MKNYKKHGIIIAVISVLMLAILFPTFFPEETPAGYPFKKMRLGLDLRGGSYLILGVKTDEALKSHLSTIATNLRSELREKKLGVLRARQIGQNQIQVQLASSNSLDGVKEFVKTNYKELELDKEGLTPNDPTLTYKITGTAEKEYHKNAVSQAIETIRNRVDQFGVAEPTIQKSGEDRLMVQLPEITNIEEVKKTLGSVAKLDFRLVANENTPASTTITLPSKAGGTVTLEDEVLMSGDAIESAQVEVNPRSNEIEVSLKLNSYGAQTFARITSENQGRHLAIILDGRVQSYPRINEPIREGRAVINGGFSKEEAKQLSIVLRSGALPAPLTFEEERTVGATLGADSISKGVKASMIGIVFTLAFVVLYYKKAGVLAVFCLLLNILILLASLSLLGATLTLPGIAGLALTISMSIDSNVIIFERIREELRSGASIKSAIFSGFERAFVTIVDSNLTTLLTGVVLMLFGTGPIKGFAVTLNLGILSSMFTALYACKLGFEAFELKNSKGELSI